jgi:acetolactate synthase small subunit
MTRRFSLLVDDAPGVLVRVCGLCLRRGADVRSLSFGPARQPGWARLDLEVEVDERRGRSLAARLAAVVEVRDVAELQASAPPLALVH